MHIPKPFQCTDQSIQFNFIQEYPFANLVAQTEKGLCCNHLPLLLAEHNDKHYLQGHIAKVNPLWKLLNDKAQVLVVFNGPNHYISPNYYPTKQRHGRAVPTWNYQALQVRGAIHFIQDTQWLLKFLDKLSAQHEQSQAEPWSIHDAPAEYIAKMLPAIVGFELEIQAMESQWKLSQNQANENIHGVIKGLKQTNTSAALSMAKLMNEYHVEDEA